MTYKVKANFSFAGLLVKGTLSMNKPHRRVIFPMGTSINQLNYYGKETNIEGLYEREF